MGSRELMISLLVLLGLAGFSLGDAVGNKTCLCDCRYAKVKKCNSVSEEKCQTEYDTKCETHKGKKICIDVPLEECTTTFEEICKSKEQCNTIYKKKCLKIPYQTCKNAPICKTIYMDKDCQKQYGGGKDKCKQVPEESCTYELKCQTEHEKKCKKVPKKDCHFVQQCQKVPQKKCQKTSKKKCEKEPDEEMCIQMPRKVCKQVEKKIPYEEQYEVCQRCRREQKEFLEAVPHEKCKKLPREVCSTKVKNDCTKVPIKKCETIFETKCKKEAYQKCDTVHRMDCKKEPFQDCKTTIKEKCQMQNKCHVEYQMQCMKPTEVPRPLHYINHHTKQPLVTLVEDYAPPGYTPTPVVSVTTRGSHNHESTYSTTTTTTLRPTSLSPPTRSPRPRPPPPPPPIPRSTTTTTTTRVPLIHFPPLPLEHSSAAVPGPPLPPGYPAVRPPGAAKHGLTAEAIQYRQDKKGAKPRLVRRPPLYRPTNHYYDVRGVKPQYVTTPRPPPYYSPYYYHQQHPPHNPTSRYHYRPRPRPPPPPPKPIQRPAFTASSKQPPSVTTFKKMKTAIYKVANKLSNSHQPGPTRIPVVLPTISPPPPPKPTGPGSFPPTVDYEPPDIKYEPLLGKPSFGPILPTQGPKNRQHSESPASRQQLLSPLFWPTKVAEYGSKVADTIDNLYGKPIRKLINVTRYVPTPAAFFGPTRYVEAEEFENERKDRDVQDGDADGEKAEKYEYEQEYAYEDDKTPKPVEAQERIQKHPYEFVNPTMYFGEARGMYDDTEQSYSNLVYSKEEAKAAEVEAEMYYDYVSDLGLETKAFLRQFTEESEFTNRMGRGDHGGGDDDDNNVLNTLDYGTIQNHCKYTPKKTCGQERVCKKGPEVDCKTAYRDTCTRVPSEKCETAYNDKCEKMPWESCTTKYDDVCKEVPYKECMTIYDRKCETSYKQVKKYRYDNVCYWPEGITKQDEPCQ